MKLYSLLYINDVVNKNDSINIKGKNKNPIDTYIKCATLLSSSCKFHNIQYQVITNNPEFLTKKLKDFNTDLSITTIKFESQIPQDASFYSAHYKLDVIKSFAKGYFGDQIGLIDLDIIMIKKFNIVDTSFNELCVYDITDHEIKSYGKNILLDSYKIFNLNNVLEPKWYGGEFIIGNIKVFEKLSFYIDLNWKIYLDNYKKLHHVGDEMLLNIAIQNLYEDGFNIVDCGKSTQHSSYPLIARWWSNRTLFKQLKFSEVQDASLLHLPADKNFLESFSDEFNPALFMRKYIKYAIKKILIRTFLNKFLNLKENKKRYVSKVI